MMRNKYIEVKLVVELAFLAGIGYGIYALTSELQEFFNLDWLSTACLLFGTASFVVVLVVTSMNGGMMKLVIPWAILLYYIFSVPALDYWSNNLNVCPIDPYICEQIAWYGQGVWQLIIATVLTLVAYGISYWEVTKDHKRK